jgi:phosphoenolpyruvate carboxykinase (GTP)
MKGLVDAGLATELKKKPHSYLFRSLPSDVARVEGRTYIASVKEDDAGPTNHWIDPVELKKTMKELYHGCMHGRAMYVIPFSMGPVGSSIGKNGIEITDSAYVVCNMDIMTRVGTKVLDNIGTNGEWIPCMHSVGKPLNNGESDNGIWPCADMDHKYISQFPKNARSGRTVQDTAETRCSERSALHSALQALWHATKGGSQSTCSSLN